MNVQAGGSSPGSAGAAGNSAATAGGGGLASAGGVGELAAAFCAAARQCCEDPSFDDCEGRLQQKLQLSLDDSLVKLDPVVLASCIASYRNLAPDCARSKLNAACRGMIVPTQALGTECTLDQACKADQGLAFCAVKASQGSTPARGTCTRVTHLAIGDKCNVTYQKQSGPELAGHFGVPIAVFRTDPAACFESDGLTCGVSDDSGPHCEPPASHGSRCADLSECTFADTCATDQTCQTRAKEGQPCGPGCARDLECTAGVCRQQRLGNSYYLYDESCNPLAPKFPLEYLQPKTW